jgi:hypothetical protein
MHPDDPHALLKYAGKAGGGSHAAARRFQCASESGGGKLPGVFFKEVQIILNSIMNCPLCF